MKKVSFVQVFMVTVGVVLAAVMTLMLASLGVAMFTGGPPPTAAGHASGANARRAMTAAEFEAAVNGKTAAEVKAALGPPDSTYRDTWNYWSRVVNPHTERVEGGRLCFGPDGKARAHLQFEAK